MRVFLDTNVLASALGTRGLCADVLRYVLASHTLVVSPSVLEELRRVLRDKFGASAKLAKALAEWLREDAVAQDDAVRLDLDLTDPADVQIVSSAAAARADVLVTGDREIQSIGAVGDMAILSPRQLWEKAKVRPPGPADLP